VIDREHLVIALDEAACADRLQLLAPDGVGRLGHG
jgi:hypothetical protein